MGLASSISHALFIYRLVANLTSFKAMQFLSRFLSFKKMAVTIRQGTLIGLQHKTKLSKKPYFTFLGVPYAKPPVNDLRFKPPVEHPGWDGKLEAFSEGNKSMQYPKIFNKMDRCSEDCLYLNIYVPQVVDEEPNEKKAVMVFIHGGAFILGSGSRYEYSPDYLLDENVIVVTMNYRLNVFGFLNFDIDECPGNMGLKDQRFAIKWVKENISAFGGDAENITIFGVSAGSAAVHSHTLSPQSAGLFQKAIMQSGNMFNPWAINGRHREAAFRLARNLGCEKDNPHDIVQYLKTVPAMDLLRKSNFKDRSDFLEYPFIPSIECDAISNPFLPAHPEVLKKTAFVVPIISGLTEMEGLVILGGVLLGRFGDKKMKKMDFRKTDLMHNFLKSQYSEEYVKKIKDFYFNEYESEETRLENIIRLQGDIFFSKDFHRSFDHHLEQSVTPVYNYEFKFDGKLNAIKNMMLVKKPKLRKSLKGACHGDDIYYLFYVHAFGILPKIDSPELKMCRTMTKLWTNFAKTGSPNSPGFSFEWKCTSVDDPKYLSINGDNTKMVDGLLCDSTIKLWEDISLTIQNE